VYFARSKPIHNPGYNHAFPAYSRDKDHSGDRPDLQEVRLVIITSTPPDPPQVHADSGRIFVRISYIFTIENFPEMRGWNR
jgi:hypothetical protein